MKYPTTYHHLLAFLQYACLRNSFHTNAFLISRSSTTHKSPFIKHIKAAATTNEKTELTASIASNFLSLFKEKAAIEEKDIIIIGGGIAGLSIALELALKHNRKVTILEKSSIKQQGKNGSGSFAAAGMLAPQSERLPLGPLLDICYESREMYSEFVKNVEELAAQGSKEYLYDGGDGGVGVGYRSKGGFIAPAFAGDSVSSWAPPEGYGRALWLDDIQVKSLEPELHPDVIGGWWFPEDTSVDARRLTCSLGAACDVLGVTMCYGEEFAVDSLDLNDGKCTGVRTVNGEVYKGTNVVVANGAWMRGLLPVPIIPHKGQSMSLRPPASTAANAPPLLNRVLFAQDTYICPKSDGRVIIGATVEPGSFDTSVTTGGVMHVLSSATGLIPALRNYVIDETWAGLRPTTPDKAPILGKTPWDNLFVAGGYWRNGILLAPKTSQLIADLVTHTLSLNDTHLLEAFAWDRFMSQDADASTKLALQSRYASSVHPLQYHDSTSHNAMVGTELGFYSDATVAKQERRKERDSLFNDEKTVMDSFEQAALAGTKDGSAFVFKDQSKDKPSTSSAKAASYNLPLIDDDHEKVLHKLNAIDAARAAESDDDDEVQQVNQPQPPVNDIVSPSSPHTNRRKERESLFNDHDTDVMDSFEQAALAGTKTGAAFIFEDQSHTDPTSTSSKASNYELPLEDDDHDTVIQKLNQIDAARAVDSDADHDTSELAQINNHQAPANGIVSPPSIKTNTDTDTNRSLEDLYQTIQKNKDKASQSYSQPTVDDSESTTTTPEQEFKFKIFHVNPATREQVLIPPGTKPDEFERMLASSSKQNNVSPTSNQGEKTFDASSNSDNTFVDRMIAAEQKGQKKQQPTTNDQTTYDGYVTLQEGNFNVDTWKHSRQQNRKDFVNQDEVGAQREE